MNLAEVTPSFATPFIISAPMLGINSSSVYDDHASYTKFDNEEGRQAFIFDFNAKDDNEFQRVSRTALNV